MGTRLMWLAFGAPFEIYDKVVPFPYNWNHDKKALKFNPPPRTLIATWLGLIFIIFGTLCSVVNIIAISSRQVWTEVDYVNLIASLAVVMVSSMLALVGLHYTRHGDEMTALFNDSYATMSEAVTRLSVWYLFEPPPLYRDILGLISLGLSALPLVLTAGSSVVLYMNMDPLYHILEMIPSTSGLGFVTLVIRVPVFVFQMTVMSRWCAFCLLLLILVLHIGNGGLTALNNVTKYPKQHYHLPQPSSTNWVMMERWRKFILSLVIIQRRIVLHTQFWSSKIGHLIFVLFSFGIFFWSVINFALIELHEVVGTLTKVGMAYISINCFAMYIVLISFVTSIEGNSLRLNKSFREVLRAHKLGKRYVATLNTARITTPFFAFKGNNQIGFFRIPFDVTVNFVMTF